MKGLGRFILFGALVLLFNLSCFAQKAKYQSDIIFRLSQYITWPTNTVSYKFVIGVVGSEKDFESFQKLALEKGGFHNNPIEVRYYECTDFIEDCQLLYISEECKIEMERIVRKTKNDPILIVSGKEGYGELGSIINFVDNDGKLKFEFNQGQANKRGLQVSEKLMNLAIII